MYAPPVFDLTPLTQQAKANRRSVVATFEVKQRHLVIFLLSLIPSMIVSAVLWRIVGVMAILTFPLVIGGALIFFEGRATGGMQLRYWETARNRQTSRAGTFMLRWRPVDMTPAPVRIVCAALRPVAVDEVDVEAMAGEMAAGDTEPAAVQVDWGLSEGQSRIGASEVQQTGPLSAGAGSWSL